MVERNGSAAVVRRAIARGSFCVLATSADGNPHAVGVLYQEIDGALYFATFQGSKKARDIRANPRVAVCIPVRKYPVGPPFCVQFEGRAEILAATDSAISALVRAGRLKRLTSHGELAEPRMCFLRVTPDPLVSTYGLGVPLLTLLRDPLRGSRRVELS